MRERGGLRDSQVSGRCSSSGALISYRKHREERARERDRALSAEGGGETMAESRPRGRRGATTTATTMAMVPGVGGTRERKEKSGCS